MSRHPPFWAPAKNGELPLHLTQNETRVYILCRTLQNAFMMFRPRHHHQSDDLAQSARNRALAVAGVLEWTAAQRRELEADQNLRKEWWLYPFTLAALFLCHYLATRYGADTVLFPLFYAGMIGSFVHLWRRQLCLQIAGAIRTFFSASPNLGILRVSRPASPVFTSRHIRPELAPPRRSIC